MIFFKKWRKQRNCMHHQYSPAGATHITYIRSELIDAGKNKRFWCVECEKVWYAW